VAEHLVDYLPSPVLTTDGGSGGLKERSGSPPVNRGSGGLNERSGSPPVVEEDAGG
jgi:hypothetical protein